MGRKDIVNKTEEIIQRYNSGETINKIARSMGCDFSVVKRILVKNNIQIRPISFYLNGKISPKRINLPEGEIIALYETNSTVKIAKMFKCHPSTIYDLLLRNKIPIKGTSFFLKGRVPYMKGKHHSEETKRKITQQNYRIMSNPEHRKKLSEIRNLGIAEGRIVVACGEKNHRYGIHLTEEHKKAISEKNSGRVMPREQVIQISATKQDIPVSEWKGFSSKEDYGIKWTERFKNSIRKRDNQVCMNCGIHREKVNRALQVHHINYDKQLTIPENCLCLCEKCHAMSNKNREYWTKLFQEKLSQLYAYDYSNGEVVIELNTNGGINGKK
jgi:intein-encoded DNA endonuclease-like protein